MAKPMEKLPADTRPQFTLEPGSGFTFRTTQPQPQVEPWKPHAELLNNTNIPLHTRQWVQRMDQHYDRRRKERGAELMRTGVLPPKEEPAVVYTEQSQAVFEKLRIARRNRRQAYFNVDHDD